MQYNFQISAVVEIQISLCCTRIRHVRTQCHARTGQYSRLLQGRCKLCSQCICVTWSQRSRRLARVPETLQKLLAVGHQSDASAHWGVGLAAGRSLCAVSVGLHCSFVDSMARQRASRGERVAEISQPGGSRGVCPNFLGGWQCIAYDLDFCMHVSACFCVGTASWLAFEVFCSHVLFACFAS